MEPEAPTSNAPESAPPPVRRFQPESLPDQVVERIDKVVDLARNDTWRTIMACCDKYVLPVALLIFCLVAVALPIKLLALKVPVANSLLTGAFFLVMYAIMGYANVKLIRLMEKSLLNTPVKLMPGMQYFLTAIWTALGVSVLVAAWMSQQQGLMSLSGALTTTVSMAVLVFIQITMSLHSDCLKIEYAADAAPGEVLIGLVQLLQKITIKLVPYLWAAFVIVTLAEICAGDRYSVPKMLECVVSAMLLPIAVYLSALIGLLALEVLKAILAIPRKLTDDR